MSVMKHVLSAAMASGRRVSISSSPPSGIFVCLHLRIDEGRWEARLRDVAACGDTKNAKQATWCVAVVMNSSAGQQREATQHGDQFLIRSLALPGCAKKQYFNQRPPAAPLSPT